MGSGVYGGWSMFVQLYRGESSQDTSRAQSIYQNQMDFQKVLTLAWKFSSTICFHVFSFVQEIQSG